MKKCKICGTKSDFLASGKCSPCHIVYIQNRKKATVYTRSLRLKAEGILKLADLYEKQKGKCVYCKKKLGGIYDVDHIVPVIHGGNNDKSNLQLLCKSCNCIKHDKSQLDFMREAGCLI